MRPARTPSEHHAITSLLALLALEGHNVREIPEFTDRPDAAFEVDDQRVAIECRTFASERVLKLHGVEMPDGKPFQIYLPLEPHVWVRDAIDAKSPKAAEYMARCQAQSIWLVLHSARRSFGHMARLFNEGLADLFHIAVWGTEHPFDRIFLTGEYDLAPICIYRTEDGPALREKYKDLTVKRIPIERHLFSHNLATEGPNGQGQITMNFNQTLERNFLLQPLDRRFRYDYTEIERVTNAFEALQTLPQLGYAQPVNALPSPAQSDA